MITSIKSENLDLNQSNLIESLSILLGDRDGFAVLESGGVLGVQAMHSNASFILLEPVLCAYSSNGSSTVVGSRGQIAKFEDPWQALRELTNQTGNRSERIPLISGYISYEALHLIENVPSTGTGNLPDYVFYLYRKVISLSQDAKCSMHEIGYSKNSAPFWQVDLQTILKATAQPKLSARTRPEVNISKIIETHSNFSRSNYIKAVNEIKELILDGDYYQVNLSQQITLPWDKIPGDYFQKLRETSPAAYSAYLNVGQIEGAKQFAIISSSPELFFRTSADEIVCSPIKGTRPRGLSTSEDSALCDELINSAKDRAELAMIVDLVRNDPGRVAKAGSVEVLNHARIESLPQVHHLVSDVKCAPAAGVHLIDIIKALFPCGSVTGAPKIAAMTAISNFEKCPRGVYTGAIGCINADGTAEFNVAIRTATISSRKLVFNVGGGIVVGSQSEAEYDETVAKAKGLIAAWAD